MNKVVTDLPIDSVRGHLLVAKALAYAIGAIDACPRERQEWSDRQDMVNLLTKNFPGWVEVVAESVEFHTGKKLDLVDYKIQGEPHPMSGIAGDVRRSISGEGAA